MDGTGAARRASVHYRHLRSTRYPGKGVLMHRGPYRYVRRATAAAATLALVAGGLTGCSSDGPDGTLDAFLAGWRVGDLSKVGFVGADGGKVAAPDVLE